MKKFPLYVAIACCLLFVFVSCDTSGDDPLQSGVPTASDTQMDMTPEAPTDDSAPEMNTETPTETDTCPETPAETESIPDSTVLDPSKTYQILFIGNSYTYYNDMPEAIFLKILRAAGYNARITAITKGGWYLIDSANPTDEVGTQVEDALAKRDFDFVILQEQSTAPILSPAKFYTGVRNLTEKLRADGATPILYSTWGRKEGHNTLAANGWTNRTMTWRIAAAYEAIAAELGLDVAYVGLAFHDVYTSHSDIELYDPDMTHPGAAGSYLAAMTIFARITGVDPTTVDYNGELNEEEAAILKEAARKAVFETPEIPETFKTSSEGVVMETAIKVDDSAAVNLTALPNSPLISVLTGGSYPNGKSFSGILGTRGTIASREYSASGLTDVQKADIADLGYGVSVIGIERMTAGAKGAETAVENLVNGHWGSSFMAAFEFDELHYNIQGETDASAPYTGLITLNFGSVHRFDAMGFASGSLEGFPGAAEVFVSDDGVNWTRVPTACWDGINGTPLVSCGTSVPDPWNSNTAKVTCLFDMAGVSGQYIRIGVVIGRSDEESKYNTVNTREILVYGEKME